jgi:hypothetical protein
MVGAVYLAGSAGADIGAVAGYAREVRKIFFFEKKKQKTFAILVPCRGNAVQTVKSFLLLFFKKEDLVFLTPADEHRVQDF